MYNLYFYCKLSFIYDNEEDIYLTTPLSGFLDPMFINKDCAT